MTRIPAWWRPLLVGGIVGGVAALGFLLGVLDTWSSRATDRLFLSRSPDPSIIIVAIDDTSIGQIGRWPWPRQVHADIIRILSQAGAKVIGYDVNFPEASDEQNDTALKEALIEAKNVVLPVELQIYFFDRRHAYYRPEDALAPLTQLSAAAASTGHSNTPPDPDGVVRRVPMFPLSSTSSTPFPSFAGEVARLAGFSDAAQRAPQDAYGRATINFPGAPFRTFRTVSAVDVLRGRADLSVMNGAVVFVGSTAADLHDALLTPTSNGVPMPGVEIHASLYDTLIGKHWLRPVSKPGFAAALVVLGLLTGLSVLRFRARWSLVCVLVLWLGTLIAGFLLFDRGHIMDLVWPSLTLIFAYAGVTLERRVTADLERRQLKSVLSRYVSASVVEALLNDPSKLKLGGERKRMTVLFSDIRGFTTISEGLTPERLVDVLNRYLTRMTNIVFQHEGVLDKYIGDAVMAFWNAPFEQPDHAYRAMATALTMQAALREMNLARAFGDVELRIGVGVNTGDMVVGNVGGEERFDYTVIGDNVNLGSRLEGLTKEYGVDILCTDATYRECAGKVFTRRLDKVAVKGKKEPVVIYQVIAFSDQVAPEVQRLVSDFDVALEAYFAKEFAACLKRCETILETYPDDGPTKTLKERAEHFLVHSPPADWDGTWVYTKK